METWRGNVFFLFQSTLLIRGATLCCKCDAPALPDFNPRSSYEERPEETLDCIPNLLISIHAPHTRSDAPDYAVTDPDPKFQSTLLIRGATSSSISNLTPVFVFQSTLLIRGATAGSTHLVSHLRFQSTLLIRGATGTNLYRLVPDCISIHAPHTRSDCHTFTPSFF